MLMWAEVYDVGTGGGVHDVSGRRINSFCFMSQRYFVLELLDAGIGLYRALFALNPAVDILYFIFPPNRTNVLLPFYASPVLPLAIAGGHAPSVAVSFNMEHGHINVRLAIPINLDAIVVRSPRPRAKAKAKS